MRPLRGHRLIPHSELAIFERSGHSPQVEEGEAFTRRLRAFLAAAAQPPPPGEAGA